MKKHGLLHRFAIPVILKTFATPRIFSKYAIAHVFGGAIMQQFELMQALFALLHFAPVFYTLKHDPPTNSLQMELLGRNSLGRDRK